MSCSETLSYLYELQRFGMKMGLDNIKRLLGYMGSPHVGLKVIHVAGTNGKGSTTAYISSILKEAGFKVGIYTSPHLIDFTERIAVNDIHIPEAKAEEILNRLKPYIERTAVESGYGHPTFFEVITAMAFIYFTEEQVDFAVLEVGLGGRLDATNVIDKPLVAVITNSDFDHMDILGWDIASIAREEAGIVKKDGLVITAAEGEALKIIKEVSREQGAKLYSVGSEIQYKSLEAALEGQTFRVKSIFSEYDNLKVTLLGKHQLLNACCAVGAVEALRFYDIKVGEESIRKGLGKACWPCRFEVVNHSPLVILDGAHNHPAARQLKQSLLEFKKGRLILVIGILKDKEIEKIVKELAPLACKVFLTAPDASRAARPEDLFKLAVKYKRNAAAVGNVEDAVRQALNEAEKGDTVCVTGSLYTVGEVKQMITAGKFKIILKG